MDVTLGVFNNVSTSLLPIRILGYHHSAIFRIFNILGVKSESFLGINWSWMTCPCLLICRLFATTTAGRLAFSRTFTLAFQHLPLRILRQPEFSFSYDDCYVLQYASDRLVYVELCPERAPTPIPLFYHGYITFGHPYLSSSFSRSPLLHSTVSTPLTFIFPLLYSFFTYSHIYLPFHVTCHSQSFLSFQLRVSLVYTFLIFHRLPFYCSSTYLRKVCLISMQSFLSFRLRFNLLTKV